MRANWGWKMVFPRICLPKLSSTGDSRESIRNWNPNFYSASSRFARITRIYDARITPLSFLGEVQVNFFVWIPAKTLHFVNRMPDLFRKFLGRLRAILCNWKTFFGPQTKPPTLSETANCACQSFLRELRGIIGAIQVRNAQMSVKSFCP